MINLTDADLEGLIKCYNCGCKYWEDLACIDCGYKATYDWLTKLSKEKK